MRALPFACRARGASRIHSSSRCERAAARLVDLLLLREPLLLLLEPARVVALPRDAAAAVELEDPARDVVEEVAVVGHGDDGAVVLLQVPLEPRHGFRVEVVGGLVEQQQVGLARATGGTARRGAARRRESLVTSASAGGQPQRVHRDLELAVEIPAVDVRRSCPAAPTARRAACRSRRRARPSRCRPPRSGRGGPSCAATPSVTLPSTSLVGSSCGSCGRKPTENPGVTRHFAAVAVVLAGDDPQQRGLARRR